MGKTWNAEKQGFDFTTDEKAVAETPDVMYIALDRNRADQMVAIAQADGFKVTSESERGQKAQMTNVVKATIEHLVDGYVQMRTAKSRKTE